MNSKPIVLLVIVWLFTLGVQAGEPVYLFHKPQAPVSATPPPLEGPVVASESKAIKKPEGLSPQVVAPKKVEGWMRNGQGCWQLKRKTHGVVAGDAVGIWHAVDCAEHKATTGQASD
jgi:hypothetical protein